MTRLRTRGWLTSIAAVFFAYAVLLTWCDLVRPEAPGMVLAPDGGRLAITHVAAGSPAEAAGIHVGDRLLTIDGRRVTTTADWVVRAIHAEFGQPWHLGIEREGRVIDVEVPIRRAPFLAGVTQAGWVLPFIRAVFFATLALAAFIAFRRPRDPVALTGALLLASLSVFSVVWPYRIGAIWRDLPVVLGAVLWVPSLLAWTIGALLCVFFIVFPATPRRPGWFWPVVLAPIAAALAAFAPDHLALVYRPETAAGAPWRQSLLFSVNVGYIVAGLIALFRTYARLTDVNEKRRIRLLVFGSAVAWAGGVLATADFLFARSDPTQSLFASRAAAAGTLAFTVFPVSIGYAILRHRLFDLRVMVRLGVQYALARGAVLSIVPILVALLAVDLVRRGNEPLVDVLRTRGVWYAAVAGLALALHRWRRRVLDAIDRRFFRERFDARALFGRLADELRAAGSLEAAAPRVAAAIASAFHPRFAAVFLRRRGARDFLAVAVTPDDWRLAPLAASSTIIKLVRALDQPLDVSATDAGSLRSRLPDHEAALVRELAIDLIVPITVGESRAEALLVLGARRSEEPYSGPDRDLLRAVATQLALLLDRQPMAAASKEESEECPTCGRCYDTGADRCEADDARLNRLNRPRVLAERYRLDQRLGQGGMGAVYRGFDAALERAVAVKVLREAFLDSGEAAERFQREARAAARFAHPNVVTVHDFGVTEQRIAFLVMELLQGRTLRQEMAASGRLPASRVEAIAADVAAAIDAAHEIGLIHRDLKPENLFLVGNGDRSLAKVLDFGIAKSVARTADQAATHIETSPGVLLGTPIYMAPEQVRQQPASPSWDLWALALVVCEMLTGSHPLALALPGDIANYEETVAAHLEASPPAWRAFFLRALAIDPAGRPASAGVFMAELRLALRA
jgi:tRNA A-37 threonylcarbamoyl transferase component Bud32